MNLYVKLMVLLCLAFSFVEAKPSTGRSSRSVASTKPANPQIRGASTDPRREADVTMPQWKEEDEKLMRNGTWWDLYPSVLPEPEPLPEMNPADSPIGKDPLAQRETILYPFVENRASVDESFLPAYLQSTAHGLIDPQRVFSETEQLDLDLLMEKLRARYGIDIYLAVFYPGQNVPPELTVHILARQLFKAGRPSLLLHIQPGDIRSAQIVGDSAWMARVGEDARKKIISTVKEAAGLFSEPTDMTAEALCAMVYCAVEDAGTARADIVRVDGVDIPDVGISFVERDIEKETSVLGFSLEKLQPLLKKYGNEALITCIAVGIFLLIAFLHYRYRRIRLLSFQPDIRLGAKNGASVSKNVNYANKINTAGEYQPVTNQHWRFLEDQYTGKSR